MFKSTSFYTPFFLNVEIYTNRPKMPLFCICFDF
nr:MAG TPA: hypothetical protein [Caudoviricetes sp.]